MKILFKVIVFCAIGYGSASCDSMSSESIRSIDLNSGNGGDGTGTGEDPIKVDQDFALFDSGLFETNISDKFSLLVSKDYLFLASAKGESSFISLSDSSVSKKPDYEYLDDEEVGVRYGNSLWVFKDNSVSRYKNIENSSDVIEGSADSISDITFKNIIYVDSDRIVALTDESIIHLRVQEDTLSLDSYPYSAYGKILGAGVTSAMQVWVLTDSMDIKMLTTTKLSQLFKLPSVPAEGRLKGVVGASLDDSYLVFEASDKIYTIGNLSKLLGGSGVYDWNKVNEFGQIYCVRCHSEDGFDRENTWLSTRRAGILKTLKAGTMPPPYAPEADKMLPSESEKVVAWIESDGKPVEPEDPEDPEDPVSDKPKRTDTIVKNVLDVVDPSCAGCHSTINRYGYWYDNALNIKAEVESGRMPKNGSLSNAEKKVILDFVKVIEAYK